MWTRFPYSEYFPKVLEYFRSSLHLSRGVGGYRGNCCGYIYYVKLVTNAAAISSLIGDTKTAVFGQKENMVRVNTGRELSVLTNSVFWAHTDNGLG